MGAWFDSVWPWSATPARSANFQPARLTNRPLPLIYGTCKPCEAKQTGSRTDPPIRYRSLRLFANCIAAQEDHGPVGILHRAGALPQALVPHQTLGRQQ